MRIVDRKTFLALPEDTLYSKYKLGVFGPLSLKGETTGNDFLTLDLATAIEGENPEERNKNLDKLDRGRSVRVELFRSYPALSCEETDQRFVVWEYWDLSNLKHWIESCQDKLSEPE